MAGNEQGESQPDDEQGTWLEHMRPGPRELKRTFWPGVKHDPYDTEDKDWANSEPDPDAP